MPVPSTKTPKFATVAVAASTPVKISADSLSTLGLPHDVIARMDAIIVHTGLQADGVTPGTATVQIVRHADDVGLNVRVFDDTADESDPYMIIDENFPSDLYFWTPDAGGVTLKVEVAIRPLMQLRPSSGGGSYLP